MMVRGLFRVVAASMLVVLIAASVEPAVTYAMGGPHDASADHACCPLSVSASVPEDRSAGSPFRCCAIGGSRSQAPAGTPMPVRTAATHLFVVPVPSWHQAMTSASAVAPRPPVITGPIPLVISTSVLLI